jgi:hypothetical protein
MNALMGFVADALMGVILGLGLDRETELRTLRAFNKLLWLQNDLITRHYQEVRIARKLKTPKRPEPADGGGFYYSGVPDGPAPPTISIN